MHCVGGDGEGIAVGNVDDGRNIDAYGFGSCGCGCE